MQVNQAHIAKWSRRTGFLLAVLALIASVDYAVTQTVDPMHLYTVCGALGSLGILVGVRLHRPRRAVAWYLLAAGNVSFVVADLIYAHQDSLGTVPFPGLADVFYLAAYPLFAGGLNLLRERRDGGSGNLIDAGILGSSAGLLAWVFLVEPYAADASLTFGAKLVSVAYPVGDLILFAVVAWVVLSAPKSSPALRWLLVATGSLLVSDAVYGFQLLEGTYTRGWVDVGYIVSYLTFGSAALHPSIARMEPAVSTPRFTKKRLVLLFLAAVLGPGLFGLVAGSAGAGDLRVLAIGTVLLFGLVLLRMSGLMSTIQTKASQLAERETELRDTVVLLRRTEAGRRRLLDRVLLTSESERSSLAIGLHDGPIQHLTTITLEADITAMELAEGDVQGATHSLDRLRAGLSQEIEVLRNMMLDLRPPVLDERGLAEALRDQFAAFRERSGISVSLDASLDQRPGRAIETVVYRVAQEALTNVVKHSGAAQVSASCRSSKGVVTFELADDGSGFSVSDVDVGGRNGHLGLASMRERVEAAGGEWRLRSTPGEGSSVRVTFPAGADKS